MDYIPLPIKLVHSDIVSTDDAPMNYEPPNTVIVNDSSEFVQFLYNDRKHLRTRHEVLAIMLAFVLVEMMQSSSTIKPYSTEAFQKVFPANRGREIFARDIRTPSLLLMNFNFLRNMASPRPSIKYYSTLKI